MERVRHSWSGKDIQELSSLLRSHNFDVREFRLPKPEIRIAYKDRIEVTAEKCKAILDPYVARITCDGEPSEKDAGLRRLIEEEYRHNFSFETAVLYPAILAFAVAMAFGYLR